MRKMGNAHMAVKITKEQVAKIFNQKFAHEELTKTLNEMFEKFDFNCLQAAHFLGQAKVEVGAYKEQFYESLNYDLKGLENTFKRCRKDGEYRLKCELAARTQSKKANQEMIANIVYSDRMGNGNYESGDGYKYIGRGTWQATGKITYQKCSDQYFKDFGEKINYVNSPQLIETPRHAVIAGFMFMRYNKLDEKAKEFDKSKTGFERFRKTFDSILNLLNLYDPNREKKWEAFKEVYSDILVCDILPSSYIVFYTQKSSYSQEYTKSLKKYLKDSKKNGYNFDKDKSTNLSDNTKFEANQNTDDSKIPSELFLEPNEDIYKKLQNKFIEVSEANGGYNKDIVKYLEEKIGRKVETNNKNAIKEILNTYNNLTMEYNKQLNGIGLVIRQKNFDMMRDKNKINEPIRIQDVIYYCLSTGEISGQDLIVKLENILGTFTADYNITPKIIGESSPKSDNAKIDVDEIKYTIKKVDITKYKELSSYNIHKLFEGKDSAGRVLLQRLNEIDNNNKRWKYPKAKRVVNDLMIEFLKIQTGFKNSEEEKYFDYHGYKDSNILRNFFIRYDHKNVISFPEEKLSGMYEKIMNIGPKLRITTFIKYYLENGIDVNKKRPEHVEILKNFHDLMGEYSTYIPPNMCTYDEYYKNQQYKSEDIQIIKGLGISTQSQFSNIMTELGVGNIKIFYINLLSENSQITENIKYVNSNAIIKCTNSGKAGKLTPKRQKPELNGGIQLGVDDTTVNKSFIDCKGTSSGKCEAVNISNWGIINEKSEVVTGVKSLFETSKSKCPVGGGEVTISNAGQSIQKDGSANPPKEPETDYSRACYFRLFENPVKDSDLAIVAGQKVLVYLAELMNKYKINGKEKENALRIREYLDKMENEKAALELRELTEYGGIWDKTSTLNSVGIICDSNNPDMTKRARYKLLSLNSVFFGYVAGSIMMKINGKVYSEDETLSRLMKDVGNKNNENPSYSNKLDPVLVMKGIKLYNSPGEVDENKLMEIVRTFKPFTHSTISARDCPYAPGKKCFKMKDMSTSGGTWKDPVANPRRTKYNSNGDVKPQNGAYGDVRTNPDGTKKYHSGLDLFALPGTEVYACLNGVVADLAENGEIAGRIVRIKVTNVKDFLNQKNKVNYSLEFKSVGEEIGIEIKETDEVYLIYMHLQKILVKKGVEVKAGDLVGLSGVSGTTANGIPSPHLHFEIATVLNPYNTGKTRRFNPARVVKLNSYNTKDQDEAVKYRYYDGKGKVLR